jgi:hypothetical protein
VRSVSTFVRRWIVNSCTLPVTNSFADRAKVHIPVPLR